MGKKIKTAGAPAATPALKRKKPILAAICLFLCALCFLGLGGFEVFSAVKPLISSEKSLVAEFSDYRLAVFVLNVWDLFSAALCPLAAIGCVLCGLFAFLKKPYLPLAIASFVTTIVALFAIDPLDGYFLGAIFAEEDALDWYLDIGWLVPSFSTAILQVIFFGALSLWALLCTFKKSRRGVGSMKGFVVATMTVVLLAMSAPLLCGIFKNLIGQADIVFHALFVLKDWTLAIRYLWNHLFDAAGTLCRVACYLAWFGAFCFFCDTVFKQQKLEDAPDETSFVEEKEERQ